MGPDIPRLFLFGGKCGRQFTPIKARLALRILGCLAIVPAAWHRVPGVPGDGCVLNRRQEPFLWSDTIDGFRNRKDVRKYHVNNGINYQPQLV